MAVPKRKTTPARTGKRRSHIKVSPKKLQKIKSQANIDCHIIQILRLDFIREDKFQIQKNNYFMTKSVIIAVDAMGGDNSPSKVLSGISEYLKTNKNVYFRIFGQNEIIKNEILKNEIKKNFYEIINCEEVINDNDSPLSAAKKKNTSMWQAINDVKEKNSDVIVSAGNTGALFVIAKLNLKMIENIDKPALSGLWPNKTGMNIVLDLGAIIECNEKNL